MAACNDFELVYNLLFNNSIPVRLYKSLNTGLTVSIAQIKGPLVNGYLCLATEAHDDDGMPHILEHLIFLGSEDYPYKGALDLLANRCMSSGVRAWTETDHTCYTIPTAGCEGFLQILPIYVDHILHPTLKESGYVTEVHHINGEGQDAGVVYCEMQAIENRAESLTRLAMLRAMYPGHCGYKSETGGILANLRDSSSHIKVLEYHRKFYHPENLFLIITGDINPEDVFHALQPVEEKIMGKGVQPSFLRPWQSEVTPLMKSVEQMIQYPAQEEEFGIVTVAWRGPLIKEQYLCLALEVLLDFLAESSISPIQIEFIETETAYCSTVQHFLIRHSETCFGFTFDSVHREYLHSIASLLRSLLKKLSAKDEKISMEQMANIIHKHELEALSNMEINAHDTLAHTIIDQCLYGNSKEDFEIRLNSIDLLRRMKAESEKFWVDLLQSLTEDKPCVVIVGEPSTNLAEEMGRSEKERIKTHREQLGSEGLEQCHIRLKDAITSNMVQPPESLLTSLPVPGIDSVHYHTLSQSSNLPGRLGCPNESFPLTDIKFAFQVDDMNTNFVQVLALLDSSNLPLELKNYLPLFTSYLMKSPILRKGELIPHEQVISRLEMDTLLTAAGLGLPMGCFLCGSFSQFVVVQIKMEEMKYKQGVQWLRDILCGTQFTSERLKIIANHMIGDICSFRRKGSNIVKTLVQNLVFSKDNIANIACFPHQLVFLTQLVSTLESKPEKSSLFIMTPPRKVIADMKTLQEKLLKLENICIHLSCDVQKLAVHSCPVDPWKCFLNGLTHHESGELTTFNVKKSLIFPEVISHTKVIVGVGDVESSYFSQVAPCLNSYHHGDLPALMVLVQYLTQIEGPMWRQIRGLGLSYRYGISVHPDLGLINLWLAKSTHVAEAYRVAQTIVTNYLNEKNQFIEAELQSAKSSLIFQIIEQEKTVWDAAQESLLLYLRNVPQDYNKEMVLKVSMVTVEDLKYVCNRYLAPLFDPSMIRCAVCVHPSRVEEVAKNFMNLGLELHVLNSLNEDLSISEH